MNKIAVVFQSKYGSTRKYAQWIAEALSCDLLERKSVKVDDLKVYDTIVYGGGLYAGGVSGFELITKNDEKLADKNLILFTCGLADVSQACNTDSIKESLKKAMSVLLQERVKVFHLRGGMDYSKLSIPHKAMMGMVRKATLKKDPDKRTQEDQELLETYGQTVDFTDQATIEPLVVYVRSLSDTECGD